MDPQPELDAQDGLPASAGWSRSAAAPQLGPSAAEAPVESDAPPQSGRVALPAEAIRRWEQFHDDEALYRRAALRLLGSQQDAEDLVQEVALRILRHPSGPRDEDHLKAWCFGMVRNAALEFHRSAARRYRSDHVDLDYLEGRVDTSHPAPDTDVDAKRVLVREQRLDDLERELLVRRFVLEQNSTEIGLAFQVSPPAVRMKLKRLLVKVRGMLTLVAGYFAITPPP